MTRADFLKLVGTVLAGGSIAPFLPAKEQNDADFLDKREIDPTAIEEACQLPPLTAQLPARTRTWEEGTQRLLRGERLRYGVSMARAGKEQESLHGDLSCYISNPVEDSGNIDGDDITFPNVTGDPIDLLLFWGEDSKGCRHVIAQTDQMAGLPATPNGGDIFIEWSKSDGIFRI